jgi:16S rRNA (adenine1518-N6/adenine1519-N6)-dimethyltransferase
VQILLALNPKPKLIILMVQKEVAARIVAHPGELSILGLSVQIGADTEIAAAVSKNSFWPKPKVDSAILRIEPKNKYPELEDQKTFFRIVKAAFAGRRKQIHNTLSAGLGIPPARIVDILKSINLNPALRPQDLSLADWIDLHRKLKNQL